METRRGFLMTCAALPILGALPPLRVVEVHYVQGWNADARLTTCDLCYENCVDDTYYDKPIRKFYRTLDEHRLIVCEHCLDEYRRNPEGA